MKGILYIASSVNGYITVGDTDSSWVSEEDGTLFEEKCREVGAVLVGGTTYDQFKGELYPFPGVFTVVLTQNVITETEVLKRARTLDEALVLFKGNRASAFLIAGGASVIGSCLAAGLIDSIYMSVHPLVIGSGLPIFKNFSGKQELEFVQVVKATQQHVVLEYKVSK